MTRARKQPKIDADLVRRLAHGARQRAEMQAQIARGEQPAGYRAMWLRQAARQVVLILARQGEVLGVEHPEDAASLGDLFDVLKTAKTMLLAMTDTAPRNEP